MLQNWYLHFNPVAFSIFGIDVHWYGIAYVTALISAFYFAKFFIKRDCRFATITPEKLETYFVYMELGIILGARIGYVFIYSPERFYYLIHPWQIFNPFSADGKFVGISGMSYHGAIIGFLIGSAIYAKLKKENLLNYLDVMALSIPLAYIFGRIGNFLNHELYGRVIPPHSLWEPFGIYINGALRYPSQLIEAFLEGVVVFIIVWWSKRWIHFKGGLIAMYGMSYSLMRFVAEFYREPDVQMGYYGVFSMGQILSLAMFGVSMILFFYAKSNANKSLNC